MAVMGVSLCEPGSDRLVSGSRDGELIAWDIERGTRVRARHTNRNVITSLKQIGHTSEFVQGSEDKMLRIWDSKSLEEAVTFPREQYIHVRESHLRRTHAHTHTCTHARARTR